jgi:AmpE protein
MKLFTILLCLALQRFFNVGVLPNRIIANCFEKYIAFFQSVFPKLKPTTTLIVTLAPILIAAALLLALFSLDHSEIAHFLLSTAILLLFIDTRDLKNCLKDYFTHIDKKEFPEAKASLSDFTSKGLPEDPGMLTRSVTQEIIWQNFTKIFAPLFWFMVLGIFGLLTYCFFTLWKNITSKIDGDLTDLKNAVTNIQDLLDWIPARLLALSFALAGNFALSIVYFIHNYRKNYTENQRFVTESGLVALGKDIVNIDYSSTDSQDNHAALTLVDRVLVIWLICIVLVTIGGLF